MSTITAIKNVLLNNVTELVRDDDEAVVQTIIFDEMSVMNLAEEIENALMAEYDRQVEEAFGGLGKK